MRFLAASLLEIVGIALLSFGLGMLALWLGVAVAGVGLVLIGLAIDPPKRAEVGES
jgi:hypothetical protein